MRSSLVAYSLYVKKGGKGKERGREITKIVSASSTFFSVDYGEDKKNQRAGWWEGETRRNQVYSSAARCIIKYRNKDGESFTFLSSLGLLVRPEVWSPLERPRWQNRIIWKCEKKSYPHHYTLR